MSERSCPLGGQASLTWRITAGVSAVVVAAGAAAFVSDALPAAIIGFAGAALLVVSAISGRCPAASGPCDAVDPDVQKHQPQTAQCEQEILNEYERR